MRARKYRKKLKMKNSSLRHHLQKITGKVLDKLLTSMIRRAVYNAHRGLESSSLCCIRESPFSPLVARSYSSVGNSRTSQARGSPHPRLQYDSDASENEYRSSPRPARNFGVSSRIITNKPKQKARYYNTVKKDSPEAEPSKRLLLPHVLSARLKKLCDDGRVDAAVSMLKNAPLDAQNTPVWNTLIWESMKAKRFKLAYDLFIDVSVAAIPVGMFCYHNHYFRHLDETARIQSDEKDFSDDVLGLVAYRALVKSSKATCSCALSLRVLSALHGRGEKARLS